MFQTIVGDTENSFYFGASYINSIENNKLNNAFRIDVLNSLLMYMNNLKQLLGKMYSVWEYGKIITLH